MSGKIIKEYQLRQYSYLCTNFVISLVIILLSFSYSIVFAADTSYYVTNLGAGSQNGTSLANAWSVSDFSSSSNWSATDNASKIDPGDTVYFSGNITSPVVIPDDASGTSGNVITIDGWEGGDANFVDDAESDQTIDTYTSTAVIDVAATENTDGTCIRLEDANDYITIQDFVFENSGYGIANFVTGDVGGKTATCNHITIRRCAFQEITSSAIDIDPIGSDYPTYITIGGSSGNGNFFNECKNNSRTEAEEGHVCGSWGDDIVYSYNYTYSTVHDNYDGVNGFSTFGHTGQPGTGLLIEYNTFDGNFQSAIAPKNYGMTGAIIRFNHLIDSGRNGISMSSEDAPGNSTFYVYGNRVEGDDRDDAHDGIRCYKYYDDIHIWANIVANVNNMGFWIGGDGRTQGDVYFYNNTGYNNGDEVGTHQYTSSDSHFSMRIRNSTGLNLRMKNNIFMDCDSYTNRDAFYVYSGSESAITALDYCTYYYTGSTVQFYYNAGHRNLAYMNTAYGATHNEAADPDFVDPSGGNFELASPTTDGDSLTTCFSVTVQGTEYQFCENDILHPDTDWGTTPPTVITTKNTGLDRGAYAYVTATGNQAPNGTITSPSGNVTITDGDELSIAGSYTDPDSDTCTYAWTLPSALIDDWDNATTYATGDLVEDDDSAGDFYKSKTDSNLNHAPPNATYWEDAETIATPGTATCTPGAAGSHNIVLTVSDDAPLADPTPAFVNVTVSAAGGGDPVTVTYGENSGNTTGKGEDTWIRGGDYASTNYEGAGDAWVQYSASATYTRKLLFSWDLSAGSTDPVSSAKLVVEFSDIGQTNTLELYSVSDAFVCDEATYNVYSTGNSWTGTHGEDTLLVTKEITTDDEDSYVEFSSAQLASYIDGKSGVGTAYLLIKQTSAQSETESIRTEEYTDGRRPYLEVTTTSDAGTTPTVVSVTCEGCSGTYTTGDTIGPLIVTYTEPVEDNCGTLTLDMEDPGSGNNSLSLQSGDGTSAWNFGSYTVEAGDAAAAWDASGITCAGGTVDASDDATNANNTLPTGATVGSLEYNTDIVIDTDTPDPEPASADWVAASGYGDGTYTTESKVCWALDFDETMYGSSSSMWPRYQLSLSYPSTTTEYAYFDGLESDTSRIRMCAYPEAGWRSTDLSVTGDMDLSGGYLVDAAGNSYDTGDTPATMSDELAIVLAYPATFTAASYAAAKTTASYMLAGDTISITGAQTTMDLYGEPACTIIGNRNTVGRAVFDGQTISGFLMSN